MKPIIYLLVGILGLLVIPIFSLFFLSFEAIDGNVFRWYLEILKNGNFISAFFISFITSLIISILTIIFSFIISLSYFQRKIRLIVILFILFMGLMPPDILSISINKLAQIIGFNKSNLFFLYFSLVQYCLPFGIIILWTRYYFIDEYLIITSQDLGLHKKSIILKILLPLSKTALISVFLFSFLLTFNEYPRTYYLSGSVEFLSEFLNGKLSSGTDNSIYAGGAISILITCFVIIAYGLILKLKSSNSSADAQ
jgi:spermidine/putrescine transport system permease protein